MCLFCVLAKIRYVLLFGVGRCGHRPLRRQGRLFYAYNREARHGGGGRRAWLGVFGLEKQRGGLCLWYWGRTYFLKMKMKVRRTEDHLFTVADKGWYSVNPLIRDCLRTRKYASNPASKCFRSLSLSCRPILKMKKRRSEDRLFITI